MANEISLSGQLALSKNGVSIAANISKQITQSGTNNNTITQNIGTSSEAIVLTDISAVGYLMFINLDSTNFVDIGIVNPAVAGSCPITLLAGEFAIVPSRIESWYAIADTAAVDLQIIALEL
jgi:hypothetical protein